MNKNREKVSVSGSKGALRSFMARVKRGESFVVTDRDTPVGILGPVAWVKRVPIARLKAKLPTYLSEVKAGRTFIVTDGGSPSAVLSAPDWIAEDDEAMQELIASGYRLGTKKEARGA